MGVCVYRKGTDIQLSKHFELIEFDCKCNGLCSTTPIHDVLMEKLELLRERAGNKPLIINSGFRCVKHNKNIGGAKNSFHTKGMAADIRLPEVLTVDKFAELAEEVGFKGIGLYNNRIHVDVRDQDYISTWDNR